MRVKSFLQQVAEHYLAPGGSELKSRCFIFPNRRSIAFFKKVFAETAVAKGLGPMVVPQMVTINDFITRSSGLVPSDRISQLLDLYSCYVRLYPKAESLDEFIYWGDVILADFNDIDKYMIDPKGLFTNIADLKALKDNYDYLSETQRKAIKRFVDRFNSRDFRVSENLSKGCGRDTKGSFKEIWDILLPLYRDFNALLRSRGEAYEGMICRSVAERVSAGGLDDILGRAWPHSSRFVFVGLNALNECEKTLLLKMRNAGIAEFCWDYAGDMIRHPLNRASLFMEQNLKLFPQAFPMDAGGVGIPKLSVISVPSSVGQVKLVSNLVKGRNPDDCALVLPDESLLMPLLDSLDPEISSINVTMGYPLQPTELHSLMQSLVALQINRRDRNGSFFYWHKPVRDILANGIFRKLTAGNEKVAEILHSLKENPSPYVGADMMAGDSLLELMFRPVAAELGKSDVQTVLAFARWQQELLSVFAGILAGLLGMALEMDLAKEYWCCVNRIVTLAQSRGESFALNARAYISLLDSLLAGVSVPFNGEPLKGLQIMGPLETRALDFSNLVLLSCNEGTFPSRSASSSFIPPELRKGFGLPTAEYKDAMWAYYFYRMISRAENVWLIYDSRTEGVKSGEESRFIKQLEYHFNLPIEWKVASAPLNLPSAKDVIEKTAADVELLRSQRLLSASSIEKYLDCPACFYYSKVKNLSKEDEISENLDAAMIGTVYHNVMRALYMGEAEMLSDRSFDKLDGRETIGEKHISADYLSSWSKRRDEIMRKVRFFICQELHCDEVSGRDLVTAEIITRYVLKTIERDMELLSSNNAKHFRILGLERPCKCSIGGFEFFGVVDRIDRIGNGDVRVVDYKTGSDDPESLDCSDEAAVMKVVESIFSGNAAERRKNKAALQFHIYDRMLQGQKLDDGKELCPEGLCNSIYSAPGMFSSAVAVYPLGKGFYMAMSKALEELLAEIADVSIPFARTEDRDVCKWCDFKMICGR